MQRQRAYNSSGRCGSQFNTPDPSRNGVDIQVVNKRTRSVGGLSLFSLTAAT